MAQAPYQAPLRARPAALLRNYSERIFKPPIETPQCGQAFCQACKRAKQARCADHAIVTAAVPTVLPTIDRSAKQPSRSNSAPQLVTAYIDCPRTEKKNKPISRETLKLLRAGMTSSCKCWLHEYARPFFVFLALSDLYAFLKANVNLWPRHLPTSFHIALIRPEYLQYALVAACWVVYQLVCGYQSALFSQMGALTTLKSRTRFSRAILEGAKLAWVSFIAAAWQTTGIRSPDVVSLCLRMISALILALLCTWTCHRRRAITGTIRRCTGPIHGVVKATKTAMHGRRIMVCIAILLLLLCLSLLAPSLSQSEQTRLEMQQPAITATRTRDMTVADAISAALPVSGPAYARKANAPCVPTRNIPEETARVFVQFANRDNAARMLFDPW